MKSLGQLKETWIDLDLKKESVVENGGARTCHRKRNNKCESGIRP